MKLSKITGPFMEVAVRMAKSAVSLHVCALNREARAANRKLDRELNKMVSINQALTVQRQRYSEARDSLVDTFERVDAEIAEAKSRVV